MKLAVVGGGWAGLAAAVRATEAGHAVTLFEMAAQYGGRAREVAVDGLGDPATPSVMSRTEWVPSTPFQRSARPMVAGRRERVSVAPTGSAAPTDGTSAR